MISFSHRQDEGGTLMNPKVPLGMDVLSGICEVSEGFGTNMDA